LTPFFEYLKTNMNMQKIKELNVQHYSLFIKTKTDFTLLWIKVKKKILSKISSLSKSTKKF